MSEAVARPSATAVIVLVLGAISVSACGSLAFLAAPTGQPVSASPEVSLRPTSDEGNGTPLFTDPPLPTFEKSPGPHPDRSPWGIPDCINWTWQVDEIRGLERLARISAVMVAGTFGGYGPGRWNTPDGKRPTSEEYLDSTYDVTIVRDVRISVETSVRGAPTDLEGAYVRGGEIGCDSIRYSHIPELEPGSRWLFFLNPGPVGDANSPVLTELLRAWPISAKNVVTTDAGALMPLDELDAAVGSIPYTPDDPSGTSEATARPTTLP
ncbi:MAG: hypothetical protein ABI725_06020 [Chloroflexota bacterium]